MDETEIDELATPDLDDPVLVEGLPGVGLVGKLAVDQLVEELEATPVRRVYSEHFPPGVSVDEEGVASLASMTFHAVETEERDLLVLEGDGQSEDAIGQYRLAEAALDVAETFEPSAIVTIGGFATGEQVDEYYVVGATAEPDSELRNVLGEAGVTFEREQGPGDIVGMSGLLVGLGARRGYDTAGLLGITPGYHVDPASARVVLEVLQDAFGFRVDLASLSEQAEEVQELLEQLQQRQQQQQQPQPAPESSESLRYFR